MPGGDGSGPLGLGPGTGRWGAGYCAGPPGTGFFAPNRRLCRGYGYRRTQTNPGGMPGEREVLKREAELLKEQLRQVEARIEAFTSKEESDV